MEIEDFSRALIDNGLVQGSGVPCSVFTPLVSWVGKEAAFGYVPASSEGEAVSIAAGMVAAGRPAFALMQNSGLGNAVNPITSMIGIYQIPIVMLVSLRGEPGKADEPQHVRMGQITRELVELCGMECHAMEPKTFRSTVADAMARGVPAAWIVKRGAITGKVAADPIDLHVRTGVVKPQESREYTATLTREKALEAILPLINAPDRHAVVSTTGKLSRELYELDDRDHTKSNRFYMVGSMGCAAGFGLGVARASRRGVLVLDGDGALIMKLGSLATIGAMKPQRYHHVVFDNGAYDSTGGQPTASPHVDFALMALAAGYRRAATVSDGGELPKVLEQHMGSDGPTLLRVLVKPGARSDLGRPTLAPRDAYIRFRDWVSV